LQQEENRIIPSMPHARFNPHALPGQATGWYATAHFKRHRQRQPLILSFRVTARHRSYRVARHQVASRRPPFSTRRRAEAVQRRHARMLIRCQRCRRGMVNNPQRLGLQETRHRQKGREEGSACSRSCLQRMRLPESVHAENRQNSRREQVQARPWPACRREGMYMQVEGQRSGKAV